MDMDVTHPSSRFVTNAGYTLVELIAVLAITAILLGTAIPSFGNLINDTQLSTQVNEFAGYLNYARSEAIKYGMHVEICKSSNGSSCDTHANWQDGWIIFVDADADRERQADDLLLKIAAPNMPALKIDYGAFPSDNYVVYYPSGRSLGNGTFTFCAKNSPPRALVLYKTGRVRAAHEMPDGSALSCT
jgi:type IV fimbrial biogenesis protein FimT